MGKDKEKNIYSILQRDSKKTTQIPLLCLLFLCYPSVIQKRDKSFIFYQIYLM